MHASQSSKAQCSAPGGHTDTVVPTDRTSVQTNLSGENLGMRTRIAAAVCGGAQLAPLVDLGRGPTVVVEYSLSRRVQSSATHKSDGLISAMLCYVTAVPQPCS